MHRPRLCALAMSLSIAWASSAMAAQQPGTEITPALQATTATASATSPAPQAAQAELQRLIALALVRDPAVQSAQALLRASQAQIRQVRSRWFPTLGLSASQTRSQDEDLGLPVERSSDRVDAQLRWNLFAGGADLAQLKALQLEAEGARFDLRRAEQDCAERIAVAYAEAVRAETVDGVAVTLLQRLHALKALVDQQVALGKSSDVDAQTSASSVLEVTVTRAEAQADARRARLKLMALTGTPAGTLPRLRLPDAPMFDTVSPPDWLDLREGNPRWQGASQRAQAARARLGPLMADLLPKVDLQLRQALQDRTTPPPTSTQRRSTAVTVSLDIPLGGEAFARRDEGSQRAEAALAEAERISLEAQIEWADAADKLMTARHTLGIHQQQIRHLDRVLKGASVQYEAGRRTLVQLIELQKMPFATRQKMADSALTQFTAQLRMLSLAGSLQEALALAESAPPDVAEPPPQL